ncbi:MAG: glycosyltransferase family 2 protein [Roseovarius sp.]|jgi:GT2 family glycosyltransferase|uniref:glycosyltransferase family 2 protein n=1 Tax=Roseovarius sp. TaxID=1486281 RepID=UPI0032EFD79D
MPEIAIIIPHYNDVVRLGRCLCALQENDLAGCEVLVVDNGSTQSLTEIQKQFPDFRFVTEAEKGAAAARNTGVQETSAPCLMFIDADCVAALDWVTVGRAVADKADLIGGRVEVFDETPPPRSGAEAFEAVFAFDFRHYIEVQGFSGTGNLITRRDVFEDVGPFRGGVSEDTDWSFRATDQGYKLIYEDRLRVGHPSRQDWPALRTKWRRLTQEQFGLKVQGPKSRLLWVVKALAMPLSAIAHLPKVFRSHKLTTSGDRWRAAVTLIRLRLLRMVWMLRQAVGLDI